eukprot:COSAG03_NODE_19613_length_333_cov_1.081197_1_plen_34_part_10
MADYVTAFVKGKTDGCVCAAHSRAPVRKSCVDNC